MSFNNILLDSITTPLDIILTSSSPKVIQPNENDSDNSVSSKSDKSHIAKIEDYISKKHDEVALKHLKRELLKEINNEIPCKSAVNSNESLLISLEEHIESLQSEIYFLREEIRQKNNFISTIFQKISMLFTTIQNMRNSYQKVIKKQLLNRKQIQLN